jgi:LysR family transcriptional regulator, chromosome initiation inhibitor
MWDYSLLEALEAVVTERSFQKAAQRLFITQSAVSQRIKQLENTLGQPAIIRSPVIRPTTVGQHLITHLRSVRLMEHSLQEKSPLKKRKVGFQPISIALNTESLSTWFIDGVKGVLEKERFVLELFIDDQDRTIQLLQKGKVWGCVTSVAQSPQGCKCIRLGEMIYYLVCSPDFKSRHFSKGVDAKSLLQAPAAIYGEFDEMHDDFLGNVFKAYRKGNPTHHFVPSPEGLVRFAVDGLAFALLPALSVESHLKKKQLVNLLPGKPYRLPLHWQTLELQTPETTRLSDAIVKYAQTVLR